MDQSVYGGPVQTLSLDAGKTQSVTLDTGASGGWYDVTVSAEGFLRRYAGRLENGHASISDPAV